MFKRLMLVSLFVMSAVALLGAEAHAGCIPLSDGGQFCADWLTGSEICKGKAAGISKICDPKTGICFGEVLCAAGGTFDPVTGSNTATCNDTNNYFPKVTDNCGIAGIACCVNPKGNASKAQGEPFTLDTVLSAATKLSSCTKNGNCKFSAELVANPNDVQCINPNWTAEDFTAAEFKAKSCFCPGTYNTTTDPPTCVPDPSTGVETCLIELCTVDSTLIQCGASAATLSYSCVSLPSP